MSLRPEASELSFDDLTVDQKSVFNHVVRVIDEVATHQNQQRRTLATDVLALEARVNQTILVDGDRGTGKTTLMKSLRRLIQTDQAIAENSKSMDSETRNRLESIRQNRVIWLQPIEMEKYFEPSNLMVAICVRLVDVCKEHRSELGQWFPTSSAKPRMLSDLSQQFSKLACEAALAWDGNMETRRAHTAPDEFGREVIRIESARTHLCHQLARLLQLLSDALGTESGCQAIFILPIDDFDMNPERCLDVVRLLRLLHHDADNIPIVAMVLGKLEQLKRVLQLKLAGTSAHVSGMQVTESFINGSFFAGHRLQMVETLRKLLPMSQRLMLRRLSGLEILNGLRPAAGSSSLLELFEKVRFSVATIGADSGSPDAHPAIGSVADLLRKSPFSVEPTTAEGASPTSAQDSGSEGASEVIAMQESSTLHSLRLYDDSARGGLEFWHQVEQLATSYQTDPTSNGDQAQGMTPLLVNMFNDALMIDEGLGEIVAASSKSLQATFAFSRTANLKISWRVSPDEIKIEPVLRDAEYFSIDAGQTASSRLGLQRLSRWRARWSSGRRQVELSDRTTALAMMAHDSIVLSPSYSGHERLLRESSQSESPLRKSPQPASDSFFYTEWSNSGAAVRVPWLCPPFRAFWECDHFAAEWERVCEWTANPKQGQGIHAASLSGFSSIERFVLAWILLGTALWDPSGLKGQLESVVRGNKFEAKSQYAEAGQWLRRLSNHLLTLRGNTIGAMFAFQPLLCDCFNEWVRHMILLMCPESGVSSGTAQAFISGYGEKEIEAVIKRGENQRRLRLRRARLAVEFNQQLGTEFWGRTMTSTVDEVEKGKWYEEALDVCRRVTRSSVSESVWTQLVATKATQGFISRLKKEREHELANSKSATRFSMKANASHVLTLLRLIRDKAIDLQANVEWNFLPAVQKSLNRHESLSPGHVMNLICENGLVPTKKEIEAAREDY